MAKGACNCGAVGFTVDENLSDVFICHCSICRRYTGSNGIAVVVIENERFRWTHGVENISTWKKPHADWQSSFCSICGSPLPVANDSVRTAIPVGLISEGGEALRVVHHIWVDSKAGWDEIGDTGKQHPEAFRG
jgi:hypothetical protein